MSTPPPTPSSGPEPEARAIRDDATRSAPEPDAKPLRADAARNRAKILDAARAAFAEHGRDAQMDDIATRAGVGVGTVYRHFPTKQSLAVAIVQQRFAMILAFIRDELLPDPDPWNALERSFEFCASTQLADRGYADAVGTIAGGSPIAGGGPHGPAVDQIEEMLDLTERLIARAHAAGVVRDDLAASDMPPLYAALASIVQAGVPDWRRYIAIVLDGLRPR
ncbi:helix-turn-helix domain-containing protein [Conexibacter stalactiti]|uniref:Helix-turn-helix domain-containing protein n=1 Tax=Conexibacter stalactiti TaxID=1940611 RepID=A0ABU4HNJ5_9ACTN|nr:helix-turn-helix domain-containing protein [Conexibacter stalactiti]MDW5594893.1 helix-turn-helix domain-containing protein [Conexibacter stalactiti]MEC5035535.1 helix-turn-helix domain-containing protein [Conexibacter stalactiti]